MSLYHLRPAHAGRLRRLKRDLHLEERKEPSAHTRETIRGIERALRLSTLTRPRPKTFRR